MAIVKHLHHSIVFLGLSITICSCDLTTNHARISLETGIDSAQVLQYAKCFHLNNAKDSNVIITIQQGGEDEANVLQEITWKTVPVQRIACLSTTHMPYLKALGCVDFIVATGFSGSKHNPEIDEAIEHQRVFNVAAGGALDKELLLRASPSLFFTYPFGGNSCQELLNAGIGCVQVTEYLEEHPLGRAEWIKLFGVLLNRSAMADSIFRHIEKRYQQAASATHPIVPLVFFGTFDGEAYYSPPGNSFIAQLIKDAGGRYYFEDRMGSSNIRLDKEEMIEIVAKADFMGTIEYGKKDWVNNIESLTSNGSPILFRCDAADRDYYGKAILEPEVLLQDLVRIFHEGEKHDNDLQYFEMCDAH